MMRQLLATLFLGLAACSLGGATVLTEGAGREWPGPGGDAGKTHHSRLTAINAENVGQLGLAWQVELGTLRDRKSVV